MRNEDMLDLMGGIDDYYIEDAAKHLTRSPMRLLRRMMQPAGAVAVAALAGFTVYVIYGVFRDGIAQQNPPVISDSTVYSSGADTPAASVSVAEGLEEVTLPPPVTETAPETTITETTTTTTTAPIPPELSDYYDENGNIIYPDASLEQKIGNTFSVNSLAVPSIYSGVMAVTVHSAQCYDSLDEADIALEDLSDLFLNDYRIGTLWTRTGDFREYRLTRNDITEDDKRWRGDYLAKRNYADFNFVRLNITVQNVNAVSVYPYVRTVEYLSDFAAMPVRDSVNGAGRDYDFNLYDLQIGVLPNPEHESETHLSSLWSERICYSSIKGQEYAADQLGRDGWVYLEPGDAVNLEIGGFVPKEYVRNWVTNEYGDTLADDYFGWDLFYPDGTDLKPYYYFGAGPTFPHVSLDFSEP